MEWINVQDNLPSEFIPILVSDGNYVYLSEIMYWIDEERKNPAFCDQRNGLTLSEITHWMPLPEPPSSI